MIRYITPRLLDFDDIAKSSDGWINQLVKSVHFLLGKKTLDLELNQLSWHEMKLYHRIFLHYQYRQNVGVTNYDKNIGKDMIA